MIQASTHNAPNWVDLSTPDPASAARFYARLLGWTIEATESPMGPYLIGRLGDRQVGGLMAPGPDDAGVPSMWTVFVHVADVDQTVVHVTQAGGTVLEPGFDIPDGRVAVVADPSGAMFGIITGLEPEGTWMSDQHGAVCWVELLTHDPEAAEPFYAAVFGWKGATQQAGGLPYTTFALDGDEVAGMLPTPDTVPAEAPSYWAVYFAVEDCEATAELATELGGRVLHPPTKAGQHRFAVLADPFDATFSILETSQSPGVE